MTTPKAFHFLFNQSPFKQSTTTPTKNRFWLILGLLGIAITSATAGALVAVSLATTPLLQSNLSDEEAKVFGQEDIASGLNFQLPELTRPVNILVMGIKVLTSDLGTLPEGARDLGYHALVNSFDGLADTMLLLRFNPIDGQLVVLSIPRDTRTQVDGSGLTKINEANVYGGPALTATTVSELLNGVPIDRYVRINVQGVEKLIDALGGVRVFVPQDMKYQDDSQHLYINLKQGEQHLNGNQALQFLRFRYDANGDIGRVQRQQMLMRALMEQTLKPATLARIPQILSVIQENIDTNLSVEELVALVGFASQVDRSNVQMTMLPGSFSSPGEYSASYWIPSHRRIAMMTERYFNTDSSLEAIAVEQDPGYLRVAVQDSTDNPEAVREALRSLRSAGYDNSYFDMPWSEPLSVTRIIAQQGDITSAEAIRQALGVGEVRVDSTGNLQSDITVQLGQDWLINRPTLEPESSFETPESRMDNISW